MAFQKIIIPVIFIIYWLRSGVWITSNRKVVKCQIGSNFKRTIHPWFIVFSIDINLELLLLLDLREFRKPLGSEWIAIKIILSYNYARSLCSTILGISIGNRIEGNCLNFHLIYNYANYEYRIQYAPDDGSRINEGGELMPFRFLEMEMKFGFWYKSFWVNNVLSDCLLFTFRGAERPNELND